MYSDKRICISERYEMVFKNGLLIRSTVLLFFLARRIFLLIRLQKLRLIVLGTREDVFLVFIVFEGFGRTSKYMKKLTMAWVEYYKMKT